jgi:dUTP pyrophosphatase
VAGSIRAFFITLQGYNLPMSFTVRVSGGGSDPEYGSAGAAGADLRASEPVTLPPGGRAAVRTGIHLDLPVGHVGLVWPRSGLAVHHGIDTLAGVIDSDYRGEVKVVLVNHGGQEFRIEAGDRIAQLLVQKVERPAFERVAALTGTGRGAGGFGSTGQ